MQYSTDLDTFTHQELIGKPDSIDAAFEAYFPGTSMLANSPLQGKKIQIPRGTLVRSTHPSYPPEGKPAGRALSVTVRSAMRGHYAPDYNQPERLSYHPADVTWVGTGGYWMDAQLRDCILTPEVEL